MPVLVFFVVLAVLFLLDLLIAFVAVLISPYTGIEALAVLDFWNWFWVIVLTGWVVGPVVALNARN